MQVVTFYQLIGDITLLALASLIATRMEKESCAQFDL